MTNVGATALLRKNLLQSLHVRSLLTKDNGWHRVLLCNLDVRLYGVRSSGSSIRHQARQQAPALTVCQLESVCPYP